MRVLDGVGCSIRENISREDRLLAGKRHSTCETDVKIYVPGFSKCTKWIFRPLSLLRASTNAIYISTCIYVHTYVYKYKYIYIYIHMCVCMCVYVCIYIYMYTCVCACVYMYVYIYMCIYIYVCVSVLHKAQAGSRTSGNCGRRALRQSASKV